MSSSPTPLPDDLAALAPPVRAAVMRHAPEYFSLDPQARERQRAQWSEERPTAIFETLMRTVLGKTEAEIAALRADDDRMSHTELDRLNALMLPLTGIGDDFFTFNEFLADGVTSLDFDTIGAYDRDDHAFQEQARAKDTPDHTPDPYRGSLYARWARYMENGALRYATLYDLAGFLCAQMDKAADAALDRLVPHSFDRGPRDGEEVSGGVLLDIGVNANGFEALHDAMMAERIRLTSAAYTRAKIAQTTRSPAVWIFGPETMTELSAEDRDPLSRTVVFSGPAAMDQVRLRHFLADCTALAGDVQEVEALGATARADITAEMDAAYARLAPLYPRGAPLPERPRHDIVMTPGALDDLAHLASDADTPDSPDTPS